MAVNPAKELAELSHVEHGIDEQEIPNGFICPLTTEIMRDPVLAADGHSYERSHIEAWFRRGETRSPKTNKPLPNLNLVENINLKQSIEDFLKQQKTNATEHTILKERIAQLEQLVQQKSESQQRLRDANQQLRQEYTEQQVELQKIQATQAEKEQRFVLVIKELQGLRIDLQAKERVITTLNQDKELLAQQLTTSAKKLEDLEALPALLEKTRVQLGEKDQCIVALKAELTQRTTAFTDDIVALKKQLKITDTALKLMLAKAGIMTDSKTYALQAYQQNQFESYQTGLAYYSTGNIAAALNIFEILMLDPNFEYYPALCLKMLYHTENTLSDAQKTNYLLEIQQNIEWFAKEAAARQVTAQNKAVYVDAHYNMGILHGTIRLPDINLHDYVRASVHFVTAAYYKHAMAAYYLGLQYQNGLGMIVDYAQALNCFFWATVTGYTDAKQDLKYLISRGLTKIAITDTADIDTEAAQALLKNMQEWHPAILTDNIATFDLCSPTVKAAQPEYEALLKRFDNFDNLPQLLDLFEKIVHSDQPNHPYYYATICFKLWQMHTEGLGTVPNTEYAKQHYLPTLKYYHNILNINIKNLTPYLLYDLAQLEGIVIPNHMRESLELMRRAADLGYAPAQYKFADFLLIINKGLLGYSATIKTLLQSDLQAYEKKYAHLLESEQQVLAKIVAQLIKHYCSLANSQGYMPAHYMRYNPRYKLTTVDAATSAKKFKECISALYMPALVACLHLEEPTNDWHSIRHHILRPSDGMASVVAILLAECEEKSKTTNKKTPHIISSSTDAPDFNVELIPNGNAIYEPVYSIAADLIDFLKTAAAQGNIEIKYAIAKIFSKFAATLSQQDASSVTEILPDSLYIRKLFEEAAAKGFAKAQYELGLIYETGKLVKQNLDNALYWYNCASKQKHQLAAKRATVLTKILSNPKSLLTNTNDASAARVATARIVGASASAAAAAQPKQPQTESKDKAIKTREHADNDAVAAREESATATAPPKIS